jgi:hypothetical protein
VFHSFYFPRVHTLAKLSEFVCNASDFDNGVADIKLLRVGSNLLAKVVEYLNRYKQQPMNPILTPLQDHTFNDFVKQKWYRDYVTQLDDAELRELKDAADYMSIDE